MKKCFTAVIVLFCVSFALYGQNESAPRKPAKITYFGVGFGTYFFGSVLTGDVKAGSGGTQVRDIDAPSGGAPAGFTMDAAFGYHITPQWAIEAQAAFGIGSGSTETGYKESHTFYANNGWGAAEDFSDHDRLSFGGSFFSIDIGASYNLWSPKNPKNPFYINAKLGLGFFSYIPSNSKDMANSSKDSGGLRYSMINGWHGGENPGADYKDTYLLDMADGFFLKPGFDFGMKFGDLRFLLNTHAKIFPTAFGNKQEAVIHDGGNRQRSVKLTLPTWIVPNVTLGIQYYF